MNRPETAAYLNQILQHSSTVLPGAAAPCAELSPVPSIPGLQVVPLSQLLCAARIVEDATSTWRRQVALHLKAIAGQYGKDQAVLLYNEVTDFALGLANKPRLWIDHYVRPDLEVALVAYPQTVPTTVAKPTLLSTPAITSPQLLAPALKQEAISTITPRLLTGTVPKLAAGVRPLEREGAIGPMPMPTISPEPMEALAVCTPDLCTVEEFGGYTYRLLTPESRAQLMMEATEAKAASTTDYGGLSWTLVDFGEPSVLSLLTQWQNEGKAIILCTALDQTADGRDVSGFAATRDVTIPSTLSAQRPDVFVVNEPSAGWTVGMVAPKTAGEAAEPSKAGLYLGIGLAAVAGVGLLYLMTR